MERNCCSNKLLQLSCCYVGLYLRVTYRISSGVARSLPSSVTPIIFRISIGSLPLIVIDSASSSDESTSLLVEGTQTSGCKSLVKSCHIRQNSDFTGSTSCFLLVMQTQFQWSKERSFPQFRVPVISILSSTRQNLCCILKWFGSFTLHFICAPEK